MRWALYYPPIVDLRAEQLATLGEAERAAVDTYRQGDVPSALSSLTLETRLNGQVMQHASLSQMIFPVPDLLSYVSQFTALSPGDVIITGTPAGVGFVRKPRLYLAPGDVVEVEISGVGTLHKWGVDKSLDPQGARLLYVSGPLLSALPHSDVAEFQRAR